MSKMEDRAKRLYKGKGRMSAARKEQTDANRKLASALDESLYASDGLEGKRTYPGTKANDEFRAKERERSAAVAKAYKAGGSAFKRGGR